MLTDALLKMLKEEHKAKKPTQMEKMILDIILSEELLEFIPKLQVFERAIAIYIRNKKSLTVEQIDKAREKFLAVT